MNAKIILLSIAIIMIGAASAATIGVSPGTVTFKDVLRGGHAERNMVITLDNNIPINVSAAARGDIASWLNFTQNFSVNGSSPYYLRVEVNPPSDVPNGNYSGFLRIKTSGLSQQLSGQNVAQVQSAIDAYVTVEITDVEINSCIAENFNVASAEKGDDVVFTTRIQNNGNVRISPSASVTVWDQEQVNIVTSTEFKSTEVTPTAEVNQTFRLSTDSLPVGQYWAEISVPDCQASEILTFDVLEPGSLKDNGIITSIVAKVWAQVGETLPILVNFKNTGEKEEVANFKGEITKEGKIIQVVDTDSLSVMPNEVTNFTFYLTPQETGTYIASGRVFYNKKRTFESSTVINVTQKGFSLSSIFMPIIYAILIVAAAILIVRIRQERKLQKSRINEIRSLK